MKTTDDFFDERTDQSAVKSKIVANYFGAWARVMLGAMKQQANPTRAYVDFFAGTGRYKDGQPSTPLLILEQAINDPALRDSLITIFNEGDPKYARALRNTIAQLPGIEALRHSPVVRNEQVGAQVVGMLPAINSGRSRTALTKRSSAS